jgi:hypothetical protein
MQHGTLGVDYGFALNSWIMRNYYLKTVIGDYPYNGKGFGGIAIFKKKSS